MKKLSEIICNKGKLILFTIFTALGFLLHFKYEVERVIILAFIFSFLMVIMDIYRIVRKITEESHSEVPKNNKLADVFTDIVSIIFYSICAAIVCTEGDISELPVYLRSMLLFLFSAGVFLIVIETIYDFAKFYLIRKK